jgi:signal transduction histidine kinase/ActR/RegA family two-component response regulator
MLGQPSDSRVPFKRRRGEAWLSSRLRESGDAVRNSTQFYKTVVVVWITLAVASVGLAALTWWQLTERLAASREAVAIRQEADTVLKLLLDAETSQRGYIITTNEGFLAPLVEARAQLPQHFDHLLELTHDTPGLLKQVSELRGQADVCLNFANRGVELRQNQGFAAAAGLLTSGEGKKVMEDVRSQVARIRSSRLDLSSIEGQAVRGQLLRASLTSLVAGVLGIGAGLLAFWLSRLMLQQQQRERSLVEARLAAERSNQEKTAFLANVSHEIRTPMNAILGFAELLERESLQPRQRQFLQSIRSSASSMLQLLNDILDMSKVEAGVLELRPEPTNPSEICNFVHALFSETIARKGLRLECRIAEDLPRSLLLDRIRMRQILVNLVGNAVKFTDTGSIEVRIRGEKQENSSQITLVLEVQDTGLGIPPDKLAAIFKPFVQAGLSPAKDQQGTGLGLAIVKRLAEVMGGTVTAASLPGQGSVFSLRFPDVPISARLPAAEKLLSSSDVNFNQLGPASLLVVDDNDTNRELIARMLEGSHHRLNFASSGDEALARAREVKLDLILMDVRMPEMDGDAVLAELRKLPGFELTPVIAVTASTLLGEEAKLKQEFSGYVRKPFSRQDLFDELSHFLPPHVEPSPEDSTPHAGSPAGTDASLGGAAPELLAKLRQLRAETWPAIRDSVAVNESKAFGRNLEELGRKWNCPALITYAQKLVGHAEEYAVADLEKDLFEFGNLVDRLDQSVAA